MTITDLLLSGAAEKVALSASGVPPLDYASLRGLMSETIDALNDHGIGRNDRVAIVLDNGPSMASAFLCVAAGATTAPLNPAYRADEFEFYLSDLKAKLLIVEAETSSPVIAVATRLGIPIARLHG